MCLVGHTRIMSVNGTTPMLSELSGKDVTVYSCTPSGDVVERTGRVREVSAVTDLVDVIFESGVSICCTPYQEWVRAFDRAIHKTMTVDTRSIRVGADRLWHVTGYWNAQGEWSAVTSRIGVQPRRVRSMLDGGMGGAAMYTLEVAEHYNFALSSGVFAGGNGLCCRGVGR